MFHLLLLLLLLVAKTPTATTTMAATAATEQKYKKMCTAHIQLFRHKQSRLSEDKMVILDVCLP